MGIHSVYSNEEIGALAKARFKEERSLQRLDGWFLVKEIRRECDAQFDNLPPALRTARTMREVIRRLPISISDHAIFAGTRRGEDLAAHYASGDLFLFPRLTETFGNVTLEAMASGLPVAA